jgi:uncharacterized membrane protein
MITEFILLLAIVLVIDLTFLNLSGTVTHFSQLIEKIQGSPMKVKPIGAVLSYLFITFVLYYFIVKRNDNMMNAFILGAGLYGVYEYTSYALLKKWDFITTLTDTVWGGILFAISLFTYNKLKRYIK